MKKKLLLKIKQEALLNRTSNITCITGLPNTKKTFLGILLSTIEPIIYFDFACKDIKASEVFLTQFNLDVFQVPFKEARQLSRSMDVIRELERGTIVLDDFNILHPYWQGQLADAVLQKQRNRIACNIITPASRYGVEQFISLPTSLLPLDKRLIDFVFVNKTNITMRGRTEVKWCF